METNHHHCEENRASSPEVQDFSRFVSGLELLVTQPWQGSQVGHRHQEGELR